MQAHIAVELASQLQSLPPEATFSASAAVVHSLNCEVSCIAVQPPRRASQPELKHRSSDVFGTAADPASDI